MDSQVQGGALSSQESPPPSQDNPPPSQDSPPPSQDSPKRPWIEYRMEYREQYTDNLIRQSTSKVPHREPQSEDRTENESGPAFTLVTTHQVALASEKSPNVIDFPPSHALHLHSQAIYKALRTVVEYYPSENLSGQIVIKWPYPILVHHYDALFQFREECARKDQKDLCVREYRAYDDIGLLLAFLDENIMPEVRAEQRRNEEGYYTWEYIWVSYRPGTTMLHPLKLDNSKRPRVIHSLSGGVFESPPKPWKVYTWYMQYDGFYLGRRMATFQFDQFDGQQRMDTMVDIEDIGSCKTEDDVSAQLEYGKTYWSLLQKQCKYFKGRSLDFPYNKVEGLVMADLDSFYSENPDKSNFLMDGDDCRSWQSYCECTVCQRQPKKPVVPLFSDYNTIDPSQQGELTPHQYFLCEDRMKTFVFRTRQWETLHVRDFREPDFDQDLIRSLVMDPRRKKTLLSLAKSFTRVNKDGDAMPKQPWSADFVKGKGNGLIFLLHGRPGVGKTCTAECIAAYAKRPLMVLTASDIGTSPQTIEDNLTKHFKTATSWGAVLLIDEADIFMERRSTSDLSRNSLVAGFLRALEYYEGILFLTTNRVGSFDDAFISRVHVQLYYADFDDDQRQAIWKTFMDKLAKDRKDLRLNMSAKEYIQSATMKERKWNGREIRNAFQTAVSLAEYDAEKDEEGKVLVTDEHLRAVVELSDDFKDYLNELHVADESRRARDRFERLD
ncbi:P-loop containing nucleoside triphosphate hydrolase protein [Xylariomycetidae sp. FL0641]|nr:P-loop containing nucleoside triphosphate hydrolase protein [Xylariomycetidae sp. FL0641]